MVLNNDDYFISINIDDDSKCDIIEELNDIYNENGIFMLNEEITESALTISQNKLYHTHRI